MRMFKFQPQGQGAEAENSFDIPSLTIPHYDQLSFHPKGTLI